MMKKIQFLSILLVLGATVCQGQYARKLESLDLDPPKLFKPVSDSEIKNLRVSRENGRAFRFGTLLSQLAFQTGVPIGVEVDVNDSGWRDYPYVPEFQIRQISDGTRYITIVGSYIFEDARRDFSVGAGDSRFEDLLDELVLQMKGYKWTIADGAINIGPKKQQSEIVTKFLETRIKHLKIPSGTDNTKLLTNLMNAVDLKGIKIQTSFKVRSPGDGKLVLIEDVEFSDLTVRQILNRLARINMCGWYVIAAPHDPNGTILVAV